jgi:hypothetical protein
VHGDGHRHVRGVGEDHEAHRVRQAHEADEAEQVARQLPADFPPWQTVYWYFNRWKQYKVTEQILPVVPEQLRIAESRNPQPSTGLIDSQRR